MTTLLESFTPDMFDAIWLTLKLAVITSAILLMITLPLAWWLANWQGRLKPYLMALFALPLVLPPTVLGFYLLIAFSPDGALGQVWQSLTGHTLAFSFEGLVIGSLIYSLPFSLQPLYSNFTQLDKRFLEVAKTLGYSPFRRFTSIVLPMSKAPIMVAFALSFAHTIGEFGVVLMIGGNIPGETQVLSIALYEQVESLAYEQAHALSLGLLLFSFMLLALLYKFNSKTIGYSSGHSGHADSTRRT